MRLIVDRRDDLTWIAIELSKQGEDRVEDGSLAEVIRHDLGVENHPVFVPAVTYPKGGKRITLHLMEGYVFVATGLPETRYFALENRSYVNQVMSTRTGPHRIRSLSVIDNDYIDTLRIQLRDMVASDIEQNATVRVTKGRYRSLEGRVIGVEGDQAYVEIKLRSLWAIATIPKVFLESIEDDDV
jgi:transcription antitermination factor NusG